MNTVLADQIVGFLRQVGAELDIADDVLMQGGVAFEPSAVLRDARPGVDGDMLMRVALCVDGVEVVLDPSGWKVCVAVPRWLEAADTVIKGAAS